MRPIRYPFNDFHKTKKPENLKAIGSTDPGKMNGTEQAYAEHLEAQRFAGEVLWWAYESVKLRLADHTFYTVDFFVMLTSGELQAHDVKGGPTQEDARVKIKVAAAQFPFRFFEVVKITTREAALTGESWKFTEF